MKRQILFLLIIAMSSTAYAQKPLTLQFNNTWKRNNLSFTSDLQLKIGDSIVFDWPSIIGPIIIKEKTDSNALFECLYTQSVLIGDSIDYTNIKVCLLSVNPNKGIFSILIDTLFFDLKSDPNETFNQLYKASRHIKIDSSFSLKTIFTYYNLAESLAKAHYHKQTKVFERLDNFYVYFPFLISNNLTTEFPACQILGKTLLLYFD